MKPLLGLSLMHEADFLKAALPLFQNSGVDVLEWSFDTIRFDKYKPDWVHQLLTEYSKNNRLIGHGVRFSLLDAKWTKRQDAWLKNLKKEVQKYKYNHITEHFGFMSSQDFHKGAPLPVPLTNVALEIGINRLQMIQQACSLPVGVENLAFSFSIEDVKQQIEFLEKLIKPSDGFLILDLHNVYCQAHNFKMDINDIIKLYPLEKIKEIHVSGGSWQKTELSKNIKRVRRDTHDERIPKVLFEVLENTLKKCRNVEYVIFERLGTTLQDKKEQIQFQKDFERLQKIVKLNRSKSTEKKPVPKSQNTSTTLPISDQQLYLQQQLILKALQTAEAPNELIEFLKKKDLKDWNVEKWDPAMVETAIFLIKRWG